MAQARRDAEELIAAARRDVQGVHDELSRQRLVSTIVRRSSARSVGWCPEEDSNLHALWALLPESSASTNSAIWADKLAVQVN